MRKTLVLLSGLFITLLFLMGCDKKSEPQAQPQVSSPVISLASGTYIGNQTVIITCSTSGATIKYTIDGSTPSQTNGSTYTGSITITASSTLKAIAYKSGYTDSLVVSRTYVIETPIVSNPTFSVAAGSYSSEQTVSISCLTSGATIRYTIDGSTPSQTIGTIYSGAILLSSTTTLKAIAYKSGAIDSSVVSAIYTINLTNTSNPSFSVAAGTYNNTQTVAITCGTIGATIRYTTDGSTPSQTIGTIYSGAITISGTTTLKAIAYKSGRLDSEVVISTYTIVVSDPVMSVASGTYSNNQTVGITSLTSGAIIRYTTDGSTPTQSIGTIYSGAITISGTTTLKAIAYKSGCSDSSVSIATYTLVVADPSFAAFSTTSNQIKILSSTTGATIRYTTDGSTPTESVGTVYSTAFAITGQQTVKAIAYKAGYTSSQVLSGIFKSFWAQNVSTNAWYQIPAQLKSTGTKSLIYVDLNSDNKVSVTQAAAMSNEFDNNIYSKITTKFATESDVDANGKVILLVLDIQDGFSGSGGYVAGYFSGINEVVDTHSNSADMLYMDCYPSTVNDSDFNTTIAHEFQHLVNFNKKYLVGGGQSQDTWINEGLSSAAETVYLNQIISWKVDYYNADPNSEIAIGQNFVSWGSWGDPLGNYSTVYLFFQWLRIHASNGDSIFNVILNSSYNDYRAVEAAANTYLYAGVWKDFLRDWFSANLFKHASSKYGYKGLITTYPTVFTLGSATGATMDMFPGEGLYLAFSGTSFSIADDTYLKYATLDTTLKSIIDETNSYSGGNVFLVYNTDGTAGGAYRTTGAFPNMGTTDMSMFVKPEKKSSQSIYPIDVVYSHQGAGHSLSKTLKNMNKKSMLKGFLRKTQ